MQVFGVDTGFAPFGLTFSVVLAIALIATWVILASSRFVQGGVVERPERVPQLYGYTVCLIALIWALVSVVSILENSLSLASPEMRRTSQFGMDPSVTSFESFRLTYDQTRRFSSPNPEAKLDTIPEQELRKRYESLRTDRIQQNLFKAKRDIVVAAVSLVIAAAVFLFHWRWLRRTT